MGGREAYRLPWGLEALRARAEEDLAGGKPWIAADRLRAVLHTDPRDHHARSLLGDALLALDEPVAAGRVLACSEREDAAALAAIDAWLAVAGDPKRPTRRELAELGEALALDDDGSLGPVASARLGERLRLARAAVAGHYATIGSGDLTTDGRPSLPPPAASTARRWLLRSGWIGFALVCAIGAAEVGRWLGL